MPSLQVAGGSIYNHMLLVVYRFSGALPRGEHTESSADSLLFLATRNGEFTSSTFFQTVRLQHLPKGVESERGLGKRRHDWDMPVISSSAAHTGSATLDDTTGAMPPTTLSDTSRRNTGVRRAERRQRGQVGAGAKSRRRRNEGGRPSVYAPPSIIMLPPIRCLCRNPCPRSFDPRSFVPQPRPNDRMRHPALARCGFGTRLFSALGPIAPLWTGGGV